MYYTPPGLMACDISTPNADSRFGRHQVRLEAAEGPITSLRSAKLSSTPCQYF